MVNKKSVVMLMARDIDRQAFKCALKTGLLPRMMLFILACLACLALSGCGDTTASLNSNETLVHTTHSVELERRPSTDRVAAIEVVDYLDRKVQLLKPAQRIVALSPHIVENLYSAGLGERIVAAVDYADYPAAAANISRIGGHSNFSVEAIVAYQPDLVVGWASGYKGFGQLVARLEQLGIPVYADDPRVLSDITRSISDLAVLGDTASTVSPALKGFTERLARLREQYSADGLPVVQLFYQIWPDPLQTLNGDHLVSAAIELCSGKNIFADAIALAPVVNIESVLAYNPEIIIASSSDNLEPAWLDDWQQWPSMRAVINRQVYFIPGDWMSRHTLRVAQGVALLCEYIDNARRFRGSTQKNTAAHRVSSAVERVLEP